MPRSIRGSCCAASKPQLCRLLVLAAILGVPVSAAAYGFLALVSGVQDWLFTDLSQALGHDSVPLWWPLPLLALAALLVGLTIRLLPGRGGHSPADGFSGRRPARCA